MLQFFFQYIEVSVSNGASQCFSTIFIITVCFFNLLRLPELQIRGALRIIQR